MMAEMEMPKLETERIILRKWQEKDVQTIADIFNDEDWSQFIGGKKSVDDCWRLMATFIGHFHFRGFTIMAIEEKESGQCIGFCGPWHPHGWPENEIAYSLLRSHQGKGYATEAAKAALRYSYEKLGWLTAISLVDPSNLTSIGVAKRLGATRDKDPAIMNGHKADIWRYPPPEKFKQLESLH